MLARIVKVYYQPCESESFIEQGFKRGQAPDFGKWYGGNGTYRIVGCIPADIKVLVVTETGTQLTFSIGQEVRRIMGYARLTAKRANIICVNHPQQIELIQSNNTWGISEAALTDWLKTK